MPTSQATIFYIIIVTVLIGLLISFIMMILINHKRNQLNHMNEMQNLKFEHENKILQTQLEIQEQTFQNISREIHDNIGLTLTLAKLQLNSLTDKYPTAIAEVVPTISLVSKAIDDLSFLSKRFNSDAIITHGLYNTLNLEIEKIKRAGIENVQFSVLGDIRFLESSSELIIFRIAQEALNNALRHAMASALEISLVYQKQVLILTITDNGKGFDLTSQQSCRIPTGIQNMKKRALALNGRFEIYSKIATGTTVSLIVPISETNESHY